MSCTVGVDGTNTNDLVVAQDELMILWTNEFVNIFLNVSSIFDIDYERSFSGCGLRLNESFSRHEFFSFIGQNSRALSDIYKNGDYWKTPHATELKDLRY